MPGGSRQPAFCLRSWIHPLRAVFPSERTISCFRHMDRTSSNAHERVLALVNEHKCAGDRTAFGYHAEHPELSGIRQSISLLTQWTTTELIPVSRLLPGRYVRISQEVISLRPFSAARLVYRDSRNGKRGNGTLLVPGLHRCLRPSRNRLSCQRQTPLRSGPF